MTTPEPSRNSRDLKVLLDPGGGTTPEALRAPAWFPQARFGAEFHWGVYTLLGQGETALCHQAVSAAEYTALAERWEPAAFDARAWMEAAAAAGLRYVILPARGADGFCLWRTATTPFCSVHT